MAADWAPSQALCCGSAEHWIKDFQTFCVLLIFGWQIRAFLGDGRFIRWKPGSFILRKMGRMNCSFSVAQG